MWLNPKKTSDLVILAEEIIKGKFHSLCSESDLVLVSFYFNILTLNKFNHNIQYIYIAVLWGSEYCQQLVLKIGTSRKPQNDWFWK